MFNILSSHETNLRCTLQPTQYHGHTAKRHVLHISRIKDRINVEEGIDEEEVDPSRL